MISSNNDVTFVTNSGGYYKGRPAIFKYTSTFASLKFLIFRRFWVPPHSRRLIDAVGPRCSPRFLSFRHGALKPFIFAQRDILLFLEGRKLKHRTSESWSNHFVPTDRKVDSQRFPLPPVCHYLDSLQYQPIWKLY